MELGWPKYTLASVWQALLLSMDPITINLITTVMNASWGLAPEAEKHSGGSWEVQHSWFLISAAANLQCHTRYLLCLSLGSGFLIWQTRSFAWGCPEALMGMFVCKPFRPEDGPRQTFLSKASITAAGTWRQCHSIEHSEERRREQSCAVRLTDKTGFERLHHFSFNGKIMWERALQESVLFPGGWHPSIFWGGTIHQIKR